MPWNKSWRKVLWAIDIVLLAGLAWMAWAVVAFYQFRSGLQDGDRVSLDRQIEWNSVLSGLRADIQAASTAPDKDANAPTPPIQSSAIDASLTRKAVLNFLRIAELDSRISQTSKSEPGSDRVFDWRRIRFAFFSGSPFAFRVDLAPDGAEAKRPLVLLFQWRGDWRLTRVFLPAETDIKAIRQAFLPRVDSPVPQQQAAPDTQRAVLFEESPPSQHGRRFTGSVVWRTEETEPTAPGGGRRIIAAHVTIAGRPLAIKVSLRRSLDRTVPAIDVIEVRFQAPPNDPASVVQDVLGIMTKQKAETAGEQLAGTPVKVSNELFLIGLSTAENDVRRNMQALTDSPWLGIPFVYGNGNRAVLAIEQGRAGAKSIAGALVR
jgi:hypothetical protein